MGANKTLNPRINGDTSESIEFELINEETNLPINLTSSTIKCQFRHQSKSGQVVGDFSIGSGITLTEPLNGKFEIDQIDVLDWIPGTYFWDVEIGLSDGRTKTYVGGTMLVKPSVTK